MRAAPGPSGGLIDAPALPSSFPYQIEAKVAEGSMGVVFRAHEPALRRPVAIKFLKLDLFASSTLADSRDEMRRRFVQEALSAAAVNAPGAVTVYRVGVHEGRPFIAMEWLEGETLATRLERDGPLSIEEGVHVARSVLATLVAAHAARVVHRDLKPSNLVLLPDGRVKVTDFGIARFGAAALVETGTGIGIGTPLYAAPEQLRGETADGRSDLYSLGVVLYQALTGRVPYDGAELPVLAARETSWPLEAPSALRREIPTALEAVILRALERNRAVRWSSAEEMAAELDASLSGETRPPTPTTRGAGTAIASPSAGLSLLVEGALRPSAQMVAQWVRSWEQRALPAQALEPLLERLLDRPLHTAPFSGALGIGERTLLLDDGQIVGAVDGRNHTYGDAALDGLPARAAATLHVPPAELGDGLVPLLAELCTAEPPGGVSLDASVLSPIGFASRLAAEGFTGRLRARAAGRDAHLLFVGGRAVVGLLGGSWPEARSHAAWPTWMLQRSLELAMTPLRPAALAATYRVLHRELRLRCNSESEGLERTSGSFALRRLPRLASRAERARRRVVLAPARSAPAPLEWEADPAVAALRWLLGEAPGAFAEAALAKRWKYLAQWIAEIETATLHATLAHRDAGRASLFDVVTRDGDEKILHLVRRLAAGSERELAAAIDDAVEVKRALVDRGDVGALVCIAPRFDDAAIRSYLERLEAQSHGMSRVQDSLTGYAGFLRVGPKRGFHVLLVEQHGERFEPMLA